LFSLVALAGLAAGCATGEELEGGLGGRGDGDGDEEPRTLDERLAGPLQLTVLDRDQGGGSLHLTAVSLTDDLSAPVELFLSGGVLTLSLDDSGGPEAIRFHDLDLGAEDVRVPETMVPPDGLLLTNLRMRLEAPADAELGLHTGDQLEAGAALSVDVGWSVEVDSGEVDLAPIHLPALDFDVSVEQDADGRVLARLRAASAGSFWSWAGIFELRDLDLDIVAASDG
jgi:hypothetical protein